MDARTLDQCVGCFERHLASELGQAVESVLVRFPVDRAPLTPILNTLARGGYGSPAQWIADLTARVHSTASALGADSPSGQCLLTLLRNIRADMRPLLPDPPPSARARLDALIDRASIIAASLPNSLEAFESAIAIHDDEALPLILPPEPYFDAPDRSALWNRCMHFRSDEEAAAVLDIVQRSEVIEDHEQETLEVDIASLSAGTVSRLAALLLTDREGDH